MKEKFTLTILVCLLITSTYAQQTTDLSIRGAVNKQGATAANNKINDLVLLGKVWGFLKYYHPQIAAGKYDWDQELIRFLPGYVNVKTNKERNDSLTAWISRFGEVPACSTCNDSLLKQAKLQPDLRWINQTNFSPALVSRLTFIQQNRIQTGQYYIRAMPADGITFVTSQRENAYSNVVLPSDTYGLLAVFRFWNAIEYWYPYKYGLPVKWDAVLKQSIISMLKHTNQQEYVLAIESLIAAIHDSHGFFRSSKTEEVMGKYYMPFTVKIVQEKVLVTSILNDSLAKRSNVQVGDIIEAIDSTPVKKVISRMALYCPASNEASLKDKLSYWLTRTSQQQSALHIKKGNTTINTTTVNYIPKAFPPVNLDPPYFTYQKDSAFCLINNGIGYINVGNFKRKDSLALQAMVAKATSLVIDNRQNQDEQNGTGGGDIIGNLIIPSGSKFARLSFPQPSYPGVFTLAEPSDLGIFSATGSFKGRIVILANEGTISVGEFLTMAFQQAPQAKVLGTTTAGADGNTTYITLPGGIFVQFTGLGVYYPDGKETQRVGIKPDIEVKQTIAGFQQHKDEQLDKAVEYLLR
jgi:C-terminal processing protease CtpA/Prc